MKKMNKSHFCLCVAIAMLAGVLAGCSGESATASPTPDNPQSDIAFSYSDGIDENGFWSGIKALDYVEMFDYASFAIPSETYMISDNSVQGEVDALLANYAVSEQITDRAVEDGDTVNIDYVGSVDGVEFDGGSTAGAGTEITIGVTSYIDDFLEQLIGHLPGETFDINVTFPEDYGEENLNGKDAVFVTTINYIVQSTNPELTDAFVAENLSAEYGWETVAEMKDGIYADLQKAAIQSYIQEYLDNDVTVTSIPDSLAEYQENAMIDYYQDSADSYGMELEEFLSSYVGALSLEELITSESDNMATSAKFNLIIQAVAEDANITVTSEDVANYFKEQMGTDDYSEYEEMYGMPYLKQAVLSQMVMDYLAEHAVLE
jgi:trigger factor